MSTLTAAPPEAAVAVAPQAWTEVLNQRFRHLENQIHHQLVKHSITGLRITLGLVFLGFGILKYFPGVSPAQNIVEATTHVLFLGLIPGAVSIKIIATLECFIGLCLLTNRWMRLCVWLLAFEFIGILSPVIIFPGRLFSGPHHAPTLLGQYCLKDIILVAAGLVVTAVSFRGGRLIRTDLPPNVRAADDMLVTDPEQRLRIVLEGLNDPDGTAEICAAHNITVGDFHLWRAAVLSAATLTLSQPMLVAAGADVPVAAGAVTLAPEAAGVATLAPEAAGVPTLAREPKPAGPLVTVAALFALRRL